ncbi:phosphotransferase family protein [Mobilicoccus caccae]|uniref:Acyl-CoA dehydrogenase n=1 Tax=Mobilicoccus caccae TaxID=1859295 RepID=A0ABQ6IQY3_9MICO|nr:phosphotransferase family protein [Mobilicoccus caccae]GMA40330.1 acyl-CoA dehydrogenase [Mobilicoccus caccae]
MSGGRSEERSDEPHTARPENMSGGRSEERSDEPHTAQPQSTTPSLEGLDLGRLGEYLSVEKPDLLSGELTGEHVAGGKSNLTYVVSDGSTSVVVRRPPMGHVLATAHDMNREYRVMTALAPTAVPVPQTYLMCTDESVIGAPFYVMEYATGTPFRRADELAPYGPERAQAISARLVDILVDLHAVDPAEVGLSDFGRPEGFLSRQVRRWTKQLEASTSRELPGAQELAADLAESVPADGDVSIIHGDYRLDNVLVDVDHDDEFTAVLDWEMATLGDPLSDVALFAVYQRLPEIGSGYAVSDVSLAPGYLPAPQLLDRYADRSGRDTSRLSWHLGLAYFKLAAILEGIHYRYIHGQTVGEGFAEVGNATIPLIAAGRAALEED